MGEKPWAILSDPFRNKGTAFTAKERDKYQLHGKLPMHISTLEEQVERRYANFRAQLSDLAKHQFLSALHQRNTTLFYKLVSEHPAEMLPYIYTPTIGTFSAQFSSLYTHPQGLFLAYPERDKLSSIIDQIDADIDVIVVTDGERILGLGDLGAGGIAISIGKLNLYTLFGGISPQRTLPVVLDVGTNNPALLNDPLYLGWSHPRMGGPDYDAFVDQFVQAIKRKFPKAVLQWEDFGSSHARPLLEKYRTELPSFNDDIQGTAAVVLAALLIATQLTHTPLQDQKIVVFGGGSAGIGICDYLMGAMTAQGISREKALSSLYVIDIHGLVHVNLPNLPPHQRPFARPASEIKAWNLPSPITLLDVISHLHPTALIGVSAQGGAFTQDIITAMAHNTPHPIIFPLSNPTTKSEANPQDLLTWTSGKAIIATGSPFEGFAQCNNVLIFPGIGLAAVASHLTEITDTLFYKAAEVLSHHSPLLTGTGPTLFPPFEHLRTISCDIALAVMEVAENEGLCPKLSPEARAQRLDTVMWTPEY